MNIYYYDLFYKKKGTPTLKELYSLSEEEIGTLLTGLKNCSVSFGEEGEMISGIDDLDSFKIIQRNYFKKQDDQYEIHFLNEDGERIEIDSHDGKERNVTNELLIKYKIRGWYYKKIGNIVLEGTKLYVDNYFVSKLDDDKKPFELMILLFKAEIFYNKTTFTYQELKDFYKTLNLKILLPSDLNDISIREIIGKKITKVRSVKNIDFLEISPDFISLWKEKETN